MEKPGPEPRPDRTEQPAPATQATPPVPPLQSAKDLKPQLKPNQNQNRNKRKRKSEDQSPKSQSQSQQGNQDRNPDQIQIQNSDETVHVQSYNYPGSLNTPSSLPSADRSQHASFSSLSSPAAEASTPGLALNPQSIATPDYPPPAPIRITEEEKIAIITRFAEKRARASHQREADTADMAARANRPRPGPSREDPAAAQEETSMWNQIVADLKICDSIKEKASELVNQVIDLERIIGKSTLLPQGTVYSPPLFPLLSQILPSSFWFLASLIHGVNIIFNFYLLSSVRVIFSTSLVCPNRGAFPMSYLPVLICMTLVHQDILIPEKHVHD